MKQIEAFVKETYQIMEVLGQGAKAKVYKVQKQGEDCCFAMKVSGDKEILRKEADFLQKISNEVFPFFYEWLEGEKAYLIMEYLEGVNLQEVLDEGVQFTVDETLWILEPVLQGLVYLHQQNPYMVYRDLKPANIVLETSGRVCLIDLGSIFCNTGKEITGARTGTYGYAPPEQFWEGMKPTPDWDVYAAGKLLGYLLTGMNPAIPPYHVEEIFQKDKRIPPVFGEVIQRCLSESKEVRYENAGDLLIALKMARDASKKKRIGRKRKGFKYKKCIWLSEYRRIF